MADNITTSNGVISTTEVTTLNGGAVSAQHAQRMILTLYAGAGTVVDVVGDATNGIWANVKNVPADPFGLNADAASATGSISAKLRYIANTGIPITGVPTIGGDLAHDDVDSGNPIKIGHKAVAYTTQTAVAVGDRSNSICDRHGVPFVIGGHPDALTVRLQFTAAQTNVAILSASAGQKIVVTGITVTLDNASTVFPSVRVGFGTSTTPTTTGVILAHGGLPAGGGVNRGDGSGILGSGGDDEDLRITTVGVATGNGVEVIVTYYMIES